jgi:haloalkane dehalogenase
MGVVRTPEERFADLPGYDFEPRYVTIADDAHGPLRMHYVDAGPPDAEPVLLVHGQPTWSYLYRKMIVRLAERGLRVIAPDYIGYGRSDKITDRLAYTFEGHVEWLTAFARTLDLRSVTLFAQDWGGPIGLGLLARETDRFARAVAADTVLHTCDPAYADVLAWANYGIDDGRVVHQEALVDWMLATQRMRDISPGAIVQSITLQPLSPAEVAAYDAPFPDEDCRAGLRQMNALIPLTRNDPGAALDRATLDVLRTWRKPFLTLWAEDDEGTAGWERVFQEEVPGAAGQAHAIVPGASHFIQEDKGAEVADLVADFVGGN